MPTDPSDPNSPKPSTRLYQTTSESSKGGGGGIFLVLLLLLLAGGGAAYYFLIFKPGAPAAAGVSPTPAATAKPASAAASPTPSTASKGNYNNAQRTQYIKDADDAFLVLRNAKTQPFTEAFNAFNTAGGFNAFGLTSKEAIAARRELVGKCLAADEDMMGFLKTQEAAYRAELQKTPLLPHDVDLTVDDFAFKAQTEKSVKVREIQRDSLKTGDGMLASLDKSFGTWTINADKHLVFTKKTAEINVFAALQKTYNDQITAMAALQKEIKDITDPNATPVPSASPAASTAVVSPSPVPAASAAH